MMVEQKSKKTIKKFSRATKASANCISQINAKFLTRKFALQSKSVFGASCMQCNLTAHYLFITARCCASAVLAMALCLSVRLCLSQVGVLLKRQKRRITQTTPPDTPGSLVFWCQSSSLNSIGVTPTRAPNAGGVVKIGDFRQITGYISKTVKDRHIVSIKVE